MNQRPYRQQTGERRIQMPCFRRLIKPGPVVLIAALTLGGCTNSSNHAPNEANAPAEAAAADGGAGVLPGTGTATDGNAFGESSGTTDTNSGSEMEENETAGQTEQSKPENEPKDTNIPDQAGVIDQVRAELKFTKALLPTKFEIENEHYLTASIEKNEDRAFNVVFYETEEAVPVGDESLAPTGETPIVAVLNAETYEDPLNQEDIFFDTPNMANIPSEMSVDLGHGIGGMKEGAAGTQYLTWKEGRWALQIQSLSVDKMDQAGIAKKMVNYLESHSLPVPDDEGRVQVNYQQGGNTVQNRISWNQGSVVYTLETQRVPLEALAMTVSAK
ncbi:hypothetical protein [Saccharibacillus kuerlensis]|uniref:Lipoprotein n=1 Tax=Saccharibacillus kuerlensis TaxID=459527 RepID=A0ABQ2L8T5_9BACL|nr:hypothetical protein [Saccharibacillus kuerlensis]GGO05922.1 hypothetical protein GCM10010969_32760 [Saccharibacillus kuerlensis]